MSIPTSLNPLGISYNDNSFYKRELNYLESSNGNQWIDTGIVFPRYSNNTFAEVDCIIDCTILPANGGFLFGGVNEYSHDDFGSVTNSVCVRSYRYNNMMYLYLYCRFLESSTDSVSYSNINEPLQLHIEVWHDYSGPGSEYSLSSQYFNKNSSLNREVDVIPGEQPFILFGCGSKTNIIETSSAGTRFYNFKLRKNVYGSATGYSPPPGLQEEIDLIPVLDKNNIPCMFDKVSQKLFYNQGTGQFLYG